MNEPAHQILKDARKEAGLTQIQVAALLSVLLSRSSAWSAAIGFQRWPTWT